MISLQIGNGVSCMAAVRKMASGRRYPQDIGRETFWRKKVKDWQASGLSVREFVRKHGLSEPRFYKWRRDIWSQDLESSVAMSANSAGSGTSKQHATTTARSLIARQASPSPGFVPLNLAAEDSAPEESKGRQGIELHTSRGIFIKVFHDSDFSLLSKLLTALEVAKC